MSVLKFRSRRADAKAHLKLRAKDQARKHAAAAISMRRECVARGVRCGGNASVRSSEPTAEYPPGVRVRVKCGPETRSADSISRRGIRNSPSSFQVAIGGLPPDVLNASGSVIYEEGRFIGSQVSQRPGFGNLLDNHRTIWFGDFP